MISISDDSKVTKTFPVENLSNKKMLSDCKQYLGDEVCFNSAKDETFHSSDNSSFAPKDAFTFSMTLSSLGSPPLVDMPPFFGTPDKGEGEIKTHSEISDQATSSINYSVVTPADFGITPESFTKHNEKAKSIANRLRRQSTIGLRGSPENNSLIRYIAYRKRMRTENSPLQASPFQRSASLKNKIAAFRSSFKPLEEAAQPKIHTPYSCSQTENTNEELSSSTTTLQQSCKKVRFAETQSLEIFDEDKAPITPLNKGHFPSTYHNSSCLRSVLKKTPVMMSAEDTKKHLDYTNTRKGSEEQSDFRSCGPLQTGQSSRPIDKMEADSKEVAVKVCDSFQCVDTPGHSGEASFSRFRTRNHSSSDTTPIKPLSQPNFDCDDGLLQDTSEVVSSIESVVNSSDMEDKETKVNFSDFHVTCVRLTRSSVKKQVNKVVETHTNLAKDMRPKRTCTTSKVPNSRKFQNENFVTKPAAKKTPASRRKAFGKRKRKRKIQKVFHGHYETVSKKPLLSPIPEMTEGISLISFYQSTPESSVSILDRSCSSLVQETPEATNKVLHSTEEGGNWLHSNLSGVKEDALPDTVSSFLQLQDAILNDPSITFPLEPPDNDSSKNLKNTLNGLKSNCSSKSEMELGLLNLQGTDEKNSKEASLHIADSVVEEPSVGDICVNLKRFPRRSRRITDYLPNVEDFQPEMPRNNPCVPTGSMEELPNTPQTINNSGLFNNVLYAIEDSFRSITSTQKRVRRSMRKLKNAESEGLEWISVPSNDSVNQALVGSDCKARRQSHAFCLPESEMLHQKQKKIVQALSPMMGDQKSAHAGVEHCRPRKNRKSICSQSQGEN